MVDDWPNVREWSNLLGNRGWEGPGGGGGGGKQGVLKWLCHWYYTSINTCTCLLNEQTPAISLLD